MRDRMITVNMFENKIIGYPIGMSKNIFYKFFEKKIFFIKRTKDIPVKFLFSICALLFLDKLNVIGYMNLWYKNVLNIWLN